MTYWILLVLTLHVTVCFLKSLKFTHTHIRDLTLESRLPFLDPFLDPQRF